MNTAAVYRDIEKKECQDNRKRLVIILLARPQNHYAKHIMRDFDYMHVNTGELCNVYAVGFSISVSISGAILRFRKTIEVDGVTWYYSDQVFNELKQYLEYILDWEYTGEITALILQNAPGEEDPLDFSGSVSIDLGNALYKGFRFHRFMEGLMHTLKRELGNRQDSIDGNNAHLDVEGITKDAFMKCLPIDSIEKELLYSQCVQRITPRWW